MVIRLMDYAVLDCMVLRQVDYKIWFYDGLIIIRFYDGCIIRFYDGWITNYDGWLYCFLSIYL